MEMKNISNFFNIVLNIHNNYNFLIYIPAQIIL